MTFSNLKKSLTLVASMFVLATQAPAAPLALESGPVITIQEAITRGTMSPIFNYVDKLLKSSEPTPKNINIIINSPGGSVFTGFRFISRMNMLKARDTKLTCYVVDLAASMAFHFLTQCDTRIVLDKSALLWHRARVQGGDTAITAPLALALSRDLQAVDDIIFTDLIKTIGKELNLEDLSYHFEKETLHVGTALCTQVSKFCKAVPAVIGLMEATVSKDAVHAAPDNPFGLFLIPGQDGDTDRDVTDMDSKWNIEYIWSGHERHVGTNNQTKGK
jgi:ATP-dependent protease ClpP protease subunit